VREEIIETGNCTWDDLHERWTPNMTVALVVLFRKMAHNLFRTGQASRRQGIGPCLVRARMVTCWAVWLGGIVTARSSLGMVRARY